MASFEEQPQARRRFLMGLGASATMVLAACQTGPRPEAPPTAGPAPTETPTPTPGARNNVAVLVPLTGENGAVGTSISNAAKMALLDTGEASITLTIYDTAQAGGAAAAANQALAAGNRLILGPLLSENVRTVGPIAARADVPVIAFSNDEGVAGDNVFIMGFTPSQSIARTVRFARERGAESFAGLIPNGVYGQRAARAFLSTVDQSGGRVAAIETYDRSRSAIQTAVDNLNNRGQVDAILIADGGATAGYAAPRLQIDARLLGTELWAAETDLGSTPALRGALYSAVPNGRFNQLAARYRARYNASPYRLSSLGYDAMLLTVRIARDWAAGRDFPVRELRDDDGFAGVDGIFRFDRTNVAQRALEVRQVTQSGASVADAAATSFGN